MVTRTRKKPKRLIMIKESAKITGLVFGILFSIAIIIMTFFPFGIGLRSEDYIQLAISSLYPIGLFIGLKWKRFGIFICLVGLVAFIVAIRIDPLTNFTYSTYTLIFFIVLFLVQMIPVTFYILTWYISWKSSTIH